MPPWPPRPRGPSRVTRMPKGPRGEKRPPTARTIRAGSPLGSAIEIRVIARTRWNGSCSTSSRHRSRAPLLSLRTPPNSNETATCGGDYEEGSWSCHLHEMLADALEKVTAAA